MEEKRMMGRISIRIKILAIVLGFFTLIAIVFAIYAAAATANYRRLRTAEVSKTVAAEGERVGRMIAEMERNVVDLALAGRQYYLAGKDDAKLGVSIPLENFSAFTSAIGGGIWYEPYVLNPEKQRICYYAFFDPQIGAVRYDPSFETEKYDYHMQRWYMETMVGVTVTGPYTTVWSTPYYDDTGTNTLMITVGSGIYDDAKRFVGMSTVDWEMKSMVDGLTAIKPTEGSFVVIVSPKDDYIISNTRAGGADTGQSLQSLPWYNELPYTSGEEVESGSFTDGGVKYIAFSRMFANGWLFSVQIPQDEIFSEIETRNNRFTLIMGGAFLALLALASLLLSRLINRPLLKLTAGVAQLGGGDLNRQLDIRSRDEFGALAAAFNKMTVDLKASIEQSARERAEKERIGAELNVATQIQSSMLPCIFPAFPDRPEFDIYASMQPAKEVGGDFYDFFLLDNDTLAIVMADVSGKGVPAALFMVIAKTLIKNNAQYGKSPKEVFETVNGLLCENNEAGMFVTAILGYLDIPTGRFTFVNAGHNPPLLGVNGGFEWVKAKAGLVLAGMEDTFYRENEIMLRPGDELFLYTDGVTEAVNNKYELFGEPRLLETAKNHAGQPLREFTVSIKRAIDEFADGAEQADDITMLVLRYGRKTT